MQKQILLLLLLMPFWLQAQLLINEVCSDNETLVQDEYGDYPDWIELYNAGATSIDLTGYYLSDNADNPLKWQFPSVSIASNSYLLIFASSKDVLDTYLHTNFKLSKDGEPLVLSNASEVVLDELTVPGLEADVSYGRLPSNPELWTYFSNPTPGSANDENSVFDFNIKPVFDEPKAFHAASVAIALSCESDDCYIRYTADGSPPDENALLYTGPIISDTTICIRARTYSSDLQPSPIATKTYFVDVTHELPVMALTTDPYLLFSWEEGIFMKGPEADSLYPFWGANFWRDVEIPMHVEYFKEHEIVTNYDVGAEIHGGRASRSKAMKSLRLIAKTEFGDEEMTYPFFEDRENDSFKRLVLRNASGDFNYTHFRDAFMHRHFMAEGLDNLDVLAYQPLVLYINGMYWGVINLREKVDKYYLRDNHNVDINNIDLLEEDTFAIEGDFEIFHQMYDAAISSDLTDDVAFAAAAKNFDMDNITDYIIVQTTLLNTDWPNNNIKYWRERKEGAKWRYILFDMDSGMGRAPYTRAHANSLEGFVEPGGYSGNKFAALFYHLIQNDNYRKYFLNRNADLLNTTFRTPTMLEVLNRTVASLDAEMFLHFQKWTWPGYDVWHEDRLPGLYDFCWDRPWYSRMHLINMFDLENEVRLKLNVFPPEAGTIQINTIVPDELPWDGYYFNGVPVTLTVTANPGYTFRHWESVHTILSPDASPQLELNFEQDDDITAFFEGEGVELELNITPNPVRRLMHVYFVLDEIETLEMNIIDVSGRVVASYDYGRVGAGAQRFDIDTGNLPAGVYILEAKTPNGKAIAKFVK